MRSFLIIIPLLFAISCTQQTQTDKENIPAITESDTNSSAEKKSETVIGLVEIYSGEDGDNIYIVQDWESRSKISLLVGDEMQDEVSVYEGEVIEVKGVVTMSGMWSGEIEVTAIVGITDKESKTK